MYRLHAIRIAKLSRAIVDGNDIVVRIKENVRRTYNAIVCAIAGPSAANDLVYKCLVRHGVTPFQ